MREAGIRVDHLDTHHHLGFLPVVGRSVEAVAQRHGIGAIRSEIETPTLSWVTDPRRGLKAGVLTGLNWLTRRQLGARRHSAQSWGYVESGRLDEIRVLEIIGRLGPGTHELICHPGEEQSPGYDHTRRAGDADVGEGAARARPARRVAVPLGGPVLSGARETADAAPAAPPHRAVRLAARRAPPS